MINILIHVMNCIFIHVMNCTPGMAGNQKSAGLQIYGGPGTLSHDFEIWPITFQGSGLSEPILLVVKKSHFNKNILLTLHKTESTCR